MNKTIFAISTLVAATVVSSVVVKSQAQTMTIPNASFKVATVVVDRGGLAFVQAEGGITSLTGTVISCTTIAFHKTANGTANSDAVKDRITNVLLSAQLSGRRVMGSISKDPSNQCVLEQVTVTNAF
jgi:hypothetical protein